MQKELDNYENELIIKYNSKFRIFELILETKQSQFYNDRSIEEGLLDYLEMEKKLLNEYLFFMREDKSFLNEIVNSSYIENGIIINFEYSLFHLYFVKRIEKNNHENDLSIKN